MTTMSETTGTGAAEAQPQQEPRHALRNSEEVIGHLVCCRDPIWDAALCGAPADGISLSAQTVCTLCIEVALELLPNFLDSDPPLCPIDQKPCPDEHDIDLRILREVSP
jgi:hypothetical protein